MCGPLTCNQVFFFFAPKKNRLIASYVASGRLSLWLEDRNDILMPSSPPPPLPSQPLLHSRGFDKGGLNSIFMYILLRSALKP